MCYLKKKSVLQDYFFQNIKSHVLSAQHTWLTAKITQCLGFSWTVRSREFHLDTPFSKMLSWLQAKKSLSSVLNGTLQWLVPRVCVAIWDLRRDEGTGRPSLEVRDVLCMCLDRAATGPWRHRKVLLSQPQHDLEPVGEVDNGMQGMGSFIKYPHNLRMCPPDIVSASGCHHPLEKEAVSQ